MTGELIEYCGCKKARDAMNEVRKLARRDTLLEVAAVVKHKILNDCGTILEKEALQRLAQELERMANES
jgi:hypothetical protein